VTKPPRRSSACGSKTAIPHRAARTFPCDRADVAAPTDRE
jgi:hypothetical protein